MTKEEIYDEQVAPLMEQIIAICKEHKIAMIASFSVPNEEDEDLMCTTSLLEDDYEPQNCQLAAHREIMGRPQSVAFTITNAS